MGEQRDVLGAMAALVAVAEEGSLTQAGARLGLSPSAVSKLVARAEARLGARLLHRTTRRVRPTEAGANYIERARRILAEVEGLEREVAARDDRPRGLLRVTAPVVLGQAQVVPVLLAYQQAWPELRVELELTDRVVDLVEESFDVAVRYSVSPASTTFVGRKLAISRRVLCASPGYLKARGTPRRPADLARHDCVLLSLEGRRPPVWRLQRGPGREEVVRVGGRLQVNNALAVHQAALAGLGVADLPSFLVHDDLRAGRLVSVLERYAPAPRVIYALYAPARPQPVKVRLLVEHLAEAFGQGTN